MKMRSSALICASVVSTLLSVLSCASTNEFQSRIEGDGNRTSDRPDRNNSPHKLLILQGRKDSALEVWLGVQYVTTNDECRSRSLGALLVGAPAVEQSVGDFVRLPPRQTDFSARFFLDRYLSGNCGWKAVGIEHAQFIPGVNNLPIPLSGVAAIRVDGINKQAIEWICREKKDSASDVNLFLDCMPEKPLKFGGPPISVDGAVIDMDYRLSPAAAY